MKTRAPLVALLSVPFLTLAACGGKQAPAPAPAAPTPVPGTSRTPPTVKAPPSDERQPRREIEAPAPVAKVDPPAKVERPEPPPEKPAPSDGDKADKPAPSEKAAKPDDDAKTDKPAEDPHGEPSGTAPGDHAGHEAMYDITVTDSAAATEIADRVPTERKTQWTIGADAKVTAWFEVKNTGDKVPLTMVWKKNGKESWRFDTEVGKGKNWRTWAEKKIGKKDAGKWTVELVDAGGHAYATLEYEVSAGATANSP